MKGARPQAQTNGEREPLRGSRSIGKGQTNQSAPDEVADGAERSLTLHLDASRLWEFCAPGSPACGAAPCLTRPSRLVADRPL